MNNLLPPLEALLTEFSHMEIPEGRKAILKPLIDHIKAKIKRSEMVKLNFICTHNSRRSQLAQVLGTAVAYHLGLPVECFSGGTEVTACNTRTIASLERSGFFIDKVEGENPQYAVTYTHGKPPLVLYSKMYDDPTNPFSDFVAAMTCDHAEANCPFIPGAELRIPLSYLDPKAYDDTAEEAERYDERSRQIGAELLFVMQQVQASLV